VPRNSAALPAPLVWTLPPPPPRQRALGREEIVSAAIAVADEAGAGGLTMKAVAARLGPYSPMALYRYVHSKEGLVDLMLDAAAAEVPVPAKPGSDWRADLRGLALGTREMIKRHGWYPVLVHTRPPAGPHLMRRTEFMLAVLVNRGLTVPVAMTYAALVDRHILGSGLQEAQEARTLRSQGLESPKAFLAAIATVHDLAAAQGDLPHLTGWLAEPTGPTVDEQFDLGLNMLLDGIAARLP
jgi:AcrR family transcriptional regulator